MSTFTDGVFAGAWGVVAIIVVGFCLKEWIAHRRELRRIDEEIERLRFKDIEDRLLRLERPKK